MVRKHCTFLSTICTNYTRVVVLYLLNGRFINYSNLLSWWQIICQQVQQLFDLYSFIWNKTTYDVIYLAFKKVFDSVPHSELLHKLRSIGKLGSLWKSFKNYLTSHQQCVAVKSTVLELLPVLSGVPQGSILGPLLFIMFVNILFADDNKCAKWIACETHHQLPQNDIHSLKPWSHKSILPLNEIKFRLLHFSSKADGNPCPYTSNGHSITPSTSHKDWYSVHWFALLGRSLQPNNLKSLQTTQLTTEDISIPNTYARTYLYLSMVRSQCPSVLQYGDPAWSNMSS